MAEEKEGTLCPICGKGKLMLNADKTIVYCSLQKSEKQGKEFVEVGECKFKIFLDQTKFFGRQLSVADVKKMVAGEGIKNKKGDTLFIDKENEEYFTRVEYGEKKPGTLI